MDRKHDRCLLVIGWSPGDGGIAARMKEVVKTRRKRPRRIARRHARATSISSYRSYDRRPTSSADAMDMQLQGFGMLVALLLSLPFFIVFLAISIYARKVRRMTYLARERDRRIELADGRRMRLCEYADESDIIEGSDGKFLVIDKDEYARRVRLAQERRSVRKHVTLNAIPTADELKTQWAKVRESHEDMLRFGSMLCDLEAHVDNSLRYDRYGEFRGRAPGVKGWLAVHCPEIWLKYKTAMGYKQMALKARQAIGMDEPYPLSMAIECSVASSTEPSGEDAGSADKTTVETIGRQEVACCADGFGSGSSESVPEAVVPARGCGDDGEAGHDGSPGGGHADGSAFGTGIAVANRDMVDIWRRRFAVLLDEASSAERPCGSSSIRIHGPGGVREMANAAGGGNDVVSKPRRITAAALARCLNARIMANEAVVCFVGEDRGRLA